jgi:hydrogenase nickel incorporation protein HypA/HybF
VTVHEYSILRALLDRVEAEARAHNATAVRRIRVRIGELAGVDAELLRSAYTLLRERSVCEEADLEIDSVEACWECPRCARRIARGAVLRCPECGAPARLASGDEIVLAQIAMEVP